MLVPRKAALKQISSIINDCYNGEHCLVLYESETWSLTLKKELNVLEQGPEENIWTQKGGSRRRLERSAY
jgi:hypothetical protein